jgi:hypothetical protein
MEIYELFNIRDAHDLTVSDTAGLPHGPTECDSCGSDIGPRDTRFVPYTIVLHADDSSSFLCMLHLEDIIHAGRSHK